MNVSSAQRDPVPLVRSNGLVLHRDFLGILERNDLASFDSLYHAVSGENFSRNPWRRVDRLELRDAGGKRRIFHLKRHALSRADRFKSILKGKKAEDGRNEWDKMMCLLRLGIPTMTPVAYGERRWRGLPWQSLTLTEHLYRSRRLEEWIPDLERLDPGEAAKRRLKACRELARIAGRFHELGLNHNDFYLGHFFIREEPFTIFLIDLQRVHRRRRIRYRDRVKDLAQMHYSSIRLRGVSPRDRLRFLKRYLGIERLDRNARRLIADVLKKAGRIERHTRKKLARKRRKTAGTESPPVGKQ